MMTATAKGPAIKFSKSNRERRATANNDDGESDGEMTAMVEQDADDVGDDDGEIDSEMMVRYIVKWSRFFCNVPPLRRLRRLKL